ncbi:hypothetical protein SDC9_157083 [bioreactor metagenome]|uniref:Uncharacterized protein n=1 Tax=bioreactor metagenome TaxID=1076179 RepID=A0A645F697_9ZZZZ
MFPTHQLGHRDAVAVCFKQQAAQHVGDLAAEFTRMDGVAPDLGQWCLRQRFRFVLAQFGGDLGLAAGHQHDGARLLVQRKADGVVGGRIAGV